MINLRVVGLLVVPVFVLVFGAACDRGAVKSGPTCDEAAAKIVELKTKGEKSVHAMEAKGAIKKTCTDAKWSDVARTCIAKAATREVLEDCAHGKLTGEQNGQLATASRTLDSSSVQEALSKMREFEGKMCQCKDMACAQAVSDEMTTWGQQMAKEQNEPPQMSEEDMKTASEIGQHMGECMQKAFAAGDPTPPVAPEPVLLK